jgi:hypothetical protein
MRDLDADVFLAAEGIDDAVLSLLTRGGARPDRLRRLIGRIVALPSPQRADAIAKLGVIAGLRNLAEQIKEDVPMSLAAELKDNPFFRDVYREGLDRGRQEGREEGRLEGERAALRRVLRSAVFEPPAALQEVIDHAGDADLGRMIDAALRATSYDDFLALAGLPASLRDC